MHWYDDGVKFRLRLRPQWTAADIASLQEEEDSENEAYRRSLRDMQGDFREYAPLMNRVVSFIQMHSSWQLDDADMVILSNLFMILTFAGRGAEHKHFRWLECAKL
jgi:hypothetical protein